VHAVIRSYSGSNAHELFDRLAERRDEVEQLLRGVTGFMSYTIIRGADGGATVTVCQSKEGTDESVQVARDWVADNAGDLGLAPPTITEGEAVLYVT
jgi:hypothetical protein